MGQSDLETSMISLFFSGTIYAWMARIPFHRCEVFLVRSLFRLIWLTSMILSVYSMGEVHWIGEGNGGDYYEERGAWLILLTISFVILMSMGYFSLMMREGDMWPALPS